MTDKSKTTSEILVESAKQTWMIFLYSILLVGAFTDLSWTQAYRNINWPLLGLQIVTMPIILVVGYWLHKLYPPLMSFGLFKFIGRLIRYPGEYEGGNINLVGISTKYLGIVLCLLILTALPSVARVEEEWFRLGTAGIGDALIRSLAFGFMHMLVGIPISAAIVLSGMGMVFTYAYYMGGIDLSIQMHFQHNLILVTLLLVAVTINSFMPSKQPEEGTE